MNPAPAGELVLHPTHPVFDLSRPYLCPVCKERIEPVTPVNYDRVQDHIVITHKECKS